MIALAPWQALLDGLGWVVAQIYELIPNYGVTIILLTIVIRLVLLPLGIKQVRSMQHMQIVQPKIKQIQAKYKGNKQRQQEEIMKLYKDYGVNPFSGCWPVLLQFPILIAMYSVLRWPQHPIHVPTDSGLYAAVSQQIQKWDGVERVLEVTGEHDIVVFVDVASTAELNDIVERIRQFKEVQSTRSRLILREY